MSDPVVVSNLKMSGAAQALYFGTKGTGWTAASRVGIKNITASDSSSEIDVTDSETTGDSKEYLAGRGASSIKFDGILKDSNGLKLSGKNISLTYNSITYPLTDFEFQHNGDKIDVTDGGTAGNGYEYLAGRVARALSSSFWLKNTVLLPAKDDLYHPFTLTLKTGITITGSAKVLSSEITNEVGSSPKAKASFNVSTVDLSAITTLPTYGVAKDFKVLFQAGVTTDSALEGNGTIYQFSLSGSFNSEIKYSGTIDVNGSATQSVAS